MRRSHRLNVALFGERLARRAGAELDDRIVDQAYSRSLGTDPLSWRAMLRRAGHSLAVSGGKLGVLTRAGNFH